MAVTHTKVSTIPDGADTSLIRPGDWNAAHSGTNTHTHTDGTTGGATLAPLDTHAADAAAHHAAPGAGPGADIDVDAAGDAGTANTYARLAHGHRVNTYSSAATDVAATAAAGTSGDAPARGSHVHEGVHSVAKSGSTALVGDVTLSAGSGITLTQTAQNIAVAAAGGGSGPTTGEIGVPATAMTPSPINGADAAELVTEGNPSIWGLSFPGGLDRSCELGFPMPSYWDGGSISAYMHWAAAATAITNLARDDFGRTTVNGWGNADVGGAYTVALTASNFQVNGSEGTMTHAASGERRAELPTAVGFLEGQIYFEHRWDKLVTGTSAYIEAGSDFRTQDTTNTLRYRVFMRRTTAATVVIYALRRVAGVDTVLGSFTTALTHTANLKLATRIEVTGTNPTNISVRAWVVGSSEPGTWDLTVQDSTASLQVAGGVSLRSLTPAAVTNFTHIVTFDGLLVTTSGTGTTAKWAIKAMCLGDGNTTAGVSWGTQGTVTDDATTGNWLISNALAFTPGNSPAGGRWVQLFISRLGTDAADVLSSEAILRGIRLLFTRT